MAASPRLVLERVDENAAAVREVAERLREQGQARVLDEGATSLLVEGELEELKRMVAGLPGWEIVPLQRIPVPDTRPRVLRRPDD